MQFKILKLARRGTASSLPWSSGEQTLSSSGICLVESHGIKPPEGRGTQESWLTFKDHLPKLGSDASQQEKARQNHQEVCMDEQGIPGLTQARNL